MFTKSIRRASIAHNVLQSRWDGFDRGDTNDVVIKARKLSVVRYYKVGSRVWDGSDNFYALYSLMV
jgi:hypothetical protein